MKHLLAASFFTATFAYGASLKGTWETACVVLGKHSYISQAFFENDRLKLDVQFFESKSCTEPTIVGAYEGSVLVENDGRIVHTAESSRYTLVQQAVVDQWNDPRTTDGCGRKDWKIGQSFEVSGQYCRPFRMPATGSQIRDLLMADGESLRFGRSPAIVGPPSPDEVPAGPRDVVFKLVRPWNR